MQKVGLDKHSFLKLSVESCYILFERENNAVEIKNDFVEKSYLSSKILQKYVSQQGLLLFPKIYRHVLSV